MQTNKDAPDQEPKPRMSKDKTNIKANSHNKLKYLLLFFFIYAPVWTQNHAKVLNLLHHKR